MRVESKGTGDKVKDQACCRSWGFLLDDLNGGRGGDACGVMSERRGERRVSMVLMREREREKEEKRNVCVLESEN